ncbi:hypothetical protein [Gilvimarinus chinensis]|nr:hypothetical protein [Gilvimarinus chinensis]
MGYDEDVLECSRLHNHPNSAAVDQCMQQRGWQRANTISISR